MKVIKFINTIPCICQRIVIHLNGKNPIKNKDTFIPSFNQLDKIQTDTCCYVI